MPPPESPNSSSCQGNVRRQCYPKKYSKLFTINTCTCKYLCKYSHLFPAMLLCKSVKQAAACLKDSPNPTPTPQRGNQTTEAVWGPCSVCVGGFGVDSVQLGEWRGWEDTSPRKHFFFLFWRWWQENWGVWHKGTWKGGGCVCHTLSAWPFAARLTSNPIVCTGRWKRQMWYDYAITTEGDGARLLAGVFLMWGVVAVDSSLI